MSEVIKIAKTLQKRNRWRETGGTKQMWVFLTFFGAVERQNLERWLY